MKSKKFSEGVEFVGLDVERNRRKSWLFKHILSMDALLDELTSISSTSQALAISMGLPADAPVAAILMEAESRISGRYGWVKAYKRKKAAK